MNDPVKPDPLNEPVRTPEMPNQPEASVGSVKYATNNVADTFGTQTPGWERATLEKFFRKAAVRSLPVPPRAHTRRAIHKYPRG